ncbi:hypothetical protein Van01_55610 [Micromonospora andamanensis]|uniref:Uncharacterized protein n=1 Tax=Micromonospora andamanensis TaxID=1287068 RepID=A0ABQ4I366_9ACTN|nr:hypothetical protein Van01_55610 [Micromonospora andamanensis]
MDEIATKCGAPARPVRALVRRPGRSATPSALRPCEAVRTNQYDPRHPGPPSAPDGLRPRRRLALSDRPHQPRSSHGGDQQYAPSEEAPIRARRLRGETAPLLQSPNPRPPAEPASVEMIGRKTFAVQGEGSNERSNERSNEERNDHELPGEHAPLNTTYPHVEGGEEGRWTGTD